MDTRTTSIITALALAASAAVATGFGSSASAEPPNQGPTLTPVTTDPSFVPTTLPPTTVPVDEVAEFGEPVDLGDSAPPRSPVTIAPIDPETQADETESGAPAELAEFAPTPQHLAPCGVVPYNLDPVGPIQLVDMTGDGTADDRISIRSEAAGDSIAHFLHLERSTGERSEARIPQVKGQTPEISFIVQLDGPTSSESHPAPDADEVLVAWNTIHTEHTASRNFDMFGTDEFGCLTRYSFSSPPQGLLFAFNGNGSAGFACDENRRITRTRAIRYNDKWNVQSQRLVRHDPTTVFAQPSNGRTEAGSEPPFLSVEC